MLSISGLDPRLSAHIAGWKTQGMQHDHPVEVTVKWDTLLYFMLSLVDYRGLTVIKSRRRYQSKCNTAFIIKWLLNLRSHIE